MISQEVFAYQKTYRSTENLKFLKSSFLQSYEAAINNFSQQDFLKVYKKNGESTSYSFAKFNEDVQCAKICLNEKITDQKVLVTIDANTYEHLVFMTAGLLLNFVLAPINPLEGLARIEQKIKQIAMPCLIFAISDIQKQLNPRLLSSELKFEQTSQRTANIERDLLEPFIYIFTSGSTGYSKIVMQPEIAVLTNVDALIELHGFDRKCKTLATPLPVFHVNALEFSFLCSLLSGQKLILYEQFHFLTVLASLDIDRVEIFSGIPQILKIFLDLAPRIEAIPNLALEYFVSAAASMSSDLALLLTKKFKFKIIQGYGLSEAVNFSAKIPPTLSKQRVDFWLTQFDRPSVGCAIRGNEITVLAIDSMLPIQEGEVGEICIRGHNVMSGYKGQPTNEIFRGDYLHTGDLGFFKICEESKEKYFFISSRIKDVIKRQGQTVSLAEIDDYLTGFMPAGTSIMAVPFENDFSGEEIGVVVNESVSAEQIELLKDFISKEIPSFMRPRIIISSNEKLTTESGKPMRWSFVNLFDSYKNRRFGDIPINQSAAKK